LGILDKIKHIFSRSDSIIRQDVTGSYVTPLGTSSTTVKTFDYVPDLIRLKSYYKNVKQHIEAISNQNSICKFLVYDLPKLATKDFFRFENEQGSEILKNKLEILDDLGLRETLQDALTAERKYGWSIIVLYENNIRLDSLSEKLNGSEITGMEAFSPYYVEVKEFDQNGDPLIYEITVENIGQLQNTKTFQVHADRVIHIRTRKKDRSYEGLSILEPIWDEIIYLVWCQHNMSSYAARLGSGFKHIKIADVVNASDFQAKASRFRGISSEKFIVTDEKTAIDEKGSGTTHAVNWTAIFDVLLDEIAAGSGVAKDLLKGVASGRVTGSETNERGIYGTLNEIQEDLVPIIKQIMVKVFPEFKQRYNIKWNLSFRMTEKDRAEVELIKAQTELIKAQALAALQPQQPLIPEKIEFVKKQDINNSRNDFASWIRTILAEEDLADEIQIIMDRKEMEYRILKYLMNKYV